jgi:enterochelin esterase-like enzyme
MTKGTIQDLTFYSKELEEEMQILIYLPPQFTPIYKYSFCIAQDGKDYFQLGRIARTLDELIDNGEMEPILFFGIPYKTVAERHIKYHPKGEKTRNYQRFLAYELVPFIQKHYPVVDNPSGRALAGDSLAATISLMTALQYPDIFGKVMLHSPYVDELVLEQVDNFTEWSKINIYHVIGTLETAVHMTDGNTADFLSLNRQLSTKLKEKAHNYIYYEIYGNHTWKYWQKDLKRGLTQLFPL